MKRLIWALESFFLNENHLSWNRKLILFWSTWASGETKWKWIWRNGFTSIVVNGIMMNMISNLLAMQSSRAHVHLGVWNRRFMINNRILWFVWVWVDNVLLLSTERKRISGINSWNNDRAEQTNFRGQRNVHVVGLNEKKTDKMRPSSVNTRSSYWTKRNEQFPYLRARMRWNKSKIRIKGGYNYYYAQTHAHSRPKLCWMSIQLSLWSGGELHYVFITSSFHRVYFVETTKDYFWSLYCALDFSQS